MTMKCATAPASKRRLYRTTIWDWLIAGVVSLLVLSMLYPFVNLLFQSLSTNAAISAANGMMLWPRELTFDNYVYIPFARQSAWDQSSSNCSGPALPKDCPPRLRSGIFDR